MVRDSGRRGRGIATYASAFVLSAVTTGAACITAPPPDLPDLPPQPPTIVHDAVHPPEGVLATWPMDGEFTVPVRMAKPGETFSFEVIYDYGTANQFVEKRPTVAPIIQNGGIELLPLPVLRAPSDTSICPHEIEVIVAANFQSFTPDPTVGGDIAKWTYMPNGTAVGCPAYDAGTGVVPEAGDQ